MWSWEVTGTAFTYSAIFFPPSLPTFWWSPDKTQWSNSVAGVILIMHYRKDSCWTHLYEEGNIGLLKQPSELGQSGKNRLLSGCLALTDLNSDGPQYTQLALCPMSSCPVCPVFQNCVNICIPCMSITQVVIGSYSYKNTIDLFE